MTLRRTASVRLSIRCSSKCLTADLHVDRQIVLSLDFYNKDNLHNHWRLTWNHAVRRLLILVKKIEIFIDKSCRGHFFLDTKRSTNKLTCRWNKTESYKLKEQNTAANFVCKIFCNWLRFKVVIDKSCRDTIIYSGYSCLV